MKKKNQNIYQQHNNCVTYYVKSHQNFEKKNVIFSLYVFYFLPDDAYSKCSCISSKRLVSYVSGLAKSALIMQSVLFIFLLLQYKFVDTFKSFCNNTPKPNVS